ncbi:hypothetical protein [Candidatus Uabimicrobium amorphum]|uniref:Uncharacterized protein n=1 Tax=Uabimicrobium amorphum TaxID=2596890 RepID=A0A5S9F2Z6_UABAM|nr:hypothetical protein [Candidatus Uabimicrobium amorphum]BBM83972.1 hypothetical protein UABAM_02327 [Candidatus Uabimicrobium amorphum]
MKRTLLFPICIIVIAVIIRVFDSNNSTKKTKTPQDTTKSQPKVISPANKSYHIKVQKHEISQTNQAVTFTISLDSNFPKDAYLQTQLLYVNPLGKALLSEKPCNMNHMKVEYGPFRATKLLPGKFEIVVFYSPSSRAPQELNKVGFTEASYHFQYGDETKYIDIYNTRFKSAQKLLANIYTLYSVSQKKYRYFKKENLGAGEWHIWQDKWLKSFEFTQNQERQYYESGYTIALFPSMKKSIGLLNIVEDLVSVDYLKAIETRGEIPPYREKRFEELFHRIQHNLEYESIALSDNPLKKLVTSYAEFAQKCSQLTASTVEPGVEHRENFLFSILELKKKYQQLKRVQKNHFVKHSNELLLDVKKIFFDRINLFDNKLCKDFTAIYLAFLYEWHQQAMEFGFIKTKPNFIPQISLEETSTSSIEKWNLKKIPLRSMKQIFKDLYSQIQDLQSKINENGNLLLEVNNLIIWQSELAKRQEKNQKLLKVDQSPQMQKLVTQYARFSMEILIFMEEAKQEQSEDVLLKTTKDLIQRLKQFSF